MSELPARLCGDAEICKYVLENHGFRLSPKTSRNLRAAGEGPRVHYFGSRVYTTPADVDRWVAERITSETWSRRAKREQTETVGEEPEATLEAELRCASSPVRPRSRIPEPADRQSEAA